MTPENKDVAGLLPSSDREHFEKAMVEAGYDKPEQGSGGGYLFQRDEDRFVGFTLAAPGAAIAAREQEVPKTLSKKDLNKLLNDFAQACAFGDVLERMAKSKAIHEYLDAAFSALASRQEAPVASGEPMFFASAEQANALEDRPGDNEGGRYLPVRKTAAGKFTMPLYASPSGAGLGGAVASSEAVSEKQIIDAIQEVLRGYSMFDPVRLIVQTGTWDPVTGLTKEGRDIADRLLALAALASQPGCAVEGEAVAPPALLVRLTSFPESNGKRNWTAMICRAEPWDGLRGNCGGITVARGEHWNRVAYEAERARFLLGERDTEPRILDYGDDIKTPDGWPGKDSAAPQVNSTEMSEGAKGSRTDGKEAL